MKLAALALLTACAPVTTWRVVEPGAVRVVCDGGASVEWRAPPDAVVNVYRCDGDGCSSAPWSTAGDVVILPCSSAGIVYRVRYLAPVDVVQ